MSFSTDYDLKHVLAVKCSFLSFWCLIFFCHKEPSSSLKFDKHRSNKFYLNLINCCWKLFTLFGIIKMFLSIIRRSSVSLSSVFRRSFAKQPKKNVNRQPDTDVNRVNEERSSMLHQFDYHWWLLWKLFMKLFFTNNFH